MMSCLYICLPRPLKVGLVLSELGWMGEKPHLFDDLGLGLSLDSLTAEDVSLDSRVLFDILDLKGSKSRWSRYAYLRKGRYLPLRRHGHR